jgi:polysaccharide export outer membrane protein
MLVIAGAWMSAGRLEAQRTPPGGAMVPPASPGQKAGGPPPTLKIEPAPPPAKAGSTLVVTPPEDYVVGVEDVLGVQFWRDDQMSGDVVVRPDGKITLRLLNDVVAAGLTTDQLRARLEMEASKYLAEPQATVVVKQINSRKVYIVGEVGKQGPLPMITPITVLQFISLAGGLSDFARKEHIYILREEGGKTLTLPFDYDAVLSKRRLELNIVLKPGDTVVVP